MAGNASDMNAAALAAALNALKNSSDGSRNRYAEPIEGLHQSTTWDADQQSLGSKMNGQQLALLAANVVMDPLAVGGNDPFESMSAEDIVAKIEGGDGKDRLNRDTVWTVAKAWDAIGERLETATTTLNTMLTKTMGAHWEGPTADKAVAAVKSFVDDSRLLAGSAVQVGFKIHFAQRGIDKTQTMLGPLLTVLRTTPPTAGPPAQKSGDSQHWSAEQEDAITAARAVLHTIYAPSITGADHGVPTLPAVTPVVHAIPGIPTVDASGGPIHTPGHDNTTSPANSVEQQPQSDQPQQQQHKPDHSAVGADKADQPEHAAPDGPGHISAASATTPTTGLVPTEAGGHTSGGSGSPGSGRVGNSPGTAGPLAAPNLGNAKAGIPTTRPPLVGAGRPGSPAMPGMGMPQAGKKTEADKEHKSADYLRGTHHLEALFDKDRKPLPAFGMPGDWAADEHPFEAPAADAPPKHQPAKPLPKTTPQPDKRDLRPPPITPQANASTSAPQANAPQENAAASAPEREPVHTEGATLL